MERVFVKCDTQNGKLDIQDYEKTNTEPLYISHIMKYITNDIDTLFLAQLNFEISKTAIEKYICIFKDGDIVLVENSPIMKDLSTIIEIYKCFSEFEIKIMEDINNISDNEKKAKIIKNIKRFVYLLLNHSLILISKLMSLTEIQNNNSKKTTLISIGIVYTNKINSLIYDEIKTIKETNQNLEMQITNFKTSKEEFSKKIANFDEIITKQNEQIKKIITFIEYDNYEGDVNIDDIVSTQDKKEEKVEDEDDDNSYEEKQDKNNNKLPISYLSDAE